MKKQYEVLNLILKTGCSPEFAAYAVQVSAKQWIVYPKNRSSLFISRFVFGESALQSALRPGKLQYNYC